MRPQVEILAPAGSMESMKAAIHAGADAVYMGGSRFGARAYADNPGEDQFLEAIDYAHLHGARLYMTVNTLVKEGELEPLYDFLRPYYERGLDAVIVQDLGVFDLVKRHFPDLPVHASTQMTVTGWRSAKKLKEMGASRIVTARELSLGEIREIQDHVDIEIESFVHGALCYCYSGQCLLSSLIGGRSGNRGRCAQPCRLPYQTEGMKKSSDRYMLSLKDLCTLDILPDIIESGVYSLKIEGRMKSPRYTAGVVSIYRKYVDQYLKQGRKVYQVDPADRKMLLDLFDRGGFTDGYYKQHNGRDMVALKEKPSFREGNQELFDRLDGEYVNVVKQEAVTGHVILKEGEPVRLSLAFSASDGTVIQAETAGDLVQPAQNQPLTEEKLLKQINKTGGSPFYFKKLTAEVSGNCFLPVQALNGLRRQGMENLKAAILEPYRRRIPSQEKAFQKEAGRPFDKTPSGLRVSLENPGILETVVSSPDVSAVYLDSTGFGAEVWKEAVDVCHQAGKSCGLILPQIFRQEAETYFKNQEAALKTAGFDCFVIRSMEEPEFLRQMDLGSAAMIFDANLYVMNHRAADRMKELGASRLTLPLELNSRELEELLGQTGRSLPWELVVYGHYPAMVSAQCIVRTTKGCKHKPELLMLKDRKGAELPVKNHCRFCYNTIYNPSPLSLLGQEELVRRLSPDSLRLSFTIEEPEQAGRILKAYGDHFLRNMDTLSPVQDFTRGHWKRGVE